MRPAQATQTQPEAHVLKPTRVPGKNRPNVNRRPARVVGKAHPQDHRGQTIRLPQYLTRQPKPQSHRSSVQAYHQRPHYQRLTPICSLQHRWLLGHQKFILFLQPPVLICYTMMTPVWSAWLLPRKLGSCMETGIQWILAVRSSLTPRGVTFSSFPWASNLVNQLRCQLAILLPGILHVSDSWQLP